MRILTGIQPTGELHIGNYFGAIRPAIDAQSTNETFLFIADYHALTQQPNSTQLQDYVFNVALDWLACGVDPEKTVFFRQSDVPEVTELAWILMCSTPVGLLERCHSYKDKIARGIAPNHGLFTYPVLMAADILLYQSQVVPVGRDQKQHLEVTRDIAIRFNNAYGDILVIPEAQIRDDTAVVPGIDGEKMSKSYGNTIPIFGDDKTVRKRFMKIVTDSTPVEAPKDPDHCTVFALHSLFADDHAQNELRTRYTAGGMGYGHAKQAAFEQYRDYFNEMRERRETLQRAPEMIETVLRSGAERARGLARETMRDVKRAVGLIA